MLLLTAAPSAMQIYANKWMSNWVIFSCLPYLHNGALAIQSNPHWDEDYTLLMLDEGLVSRKWTGVHVGQTSARPKQANFSSTI